MLWIVDNDELDAEIIRKALVDAGWPQEDLRIFYDWQVAADALTDPAQTVHLVLLDLRQPKNGMQFIERWLEYRSATAGPPVVVLTGSAPSNTQVAALYAMGIAGVIEKAVSSEDIAKQFEVFVRYWKENILLGGGW